MKGERGFEKWNMNMGNEFKRCEIQKTEANDTFADCNLLQKLFSEQHLLCDRPYTCSAVVRAGSTWRFHRQFPTTIAPRRWSTQQAGRALTIAPAIGKSSQGNPGRAREIPTRRKEIRKPIAWNKIKHEIMHHSSARLARRQTCLLQNEAHNRDSRIAGISVADGMSNRWYVRTEEGPTSRRSGGSHSKSINAKSMHSKSIARSLSSSATWPEFRCFLSNKWNCKFNFRTCKWFDFLWKSRLTRQKEKYINKKLRKTPEVLQESGMIYLIL